LARSWEGGLRRGLSASNLVKTEWNVGWACIAYVEGLGQRELRK